MSLLYLYVYALLVPVCSYYTKICYVVYAMWKLILGDYYFACFCHDYLPMEYVRRIKHRVLTCLGSHKLYVNYNVL